MVLHQLSAVSEWSFFFAPARVETFFLSPRLEGISLKFNQRRKIQKNINALLNPCSQKLSFPRNIPNASNALPTPPYPTLPQPTLPHPTPPLPFVCVGGRERDGVGRHGYTRAFGSAQLSRVRQKGQGGGGGVCVCGGVIVG